MEQHEGATSVRKCIKESLGVTDGQINYNAHTTPEPVMLEVDISYKHISDRLAPIFSQHAQCSV